MGKTLDDILSLSVEELTYWLALLEIDGPLLPQRLDQLTAINCVASCAMAAKTKVDDWLPTWEGVQKVDFQTGAQMFAAMYPK